MVTTLLYVLVEFVWIIGPCLIGDQNEAVVTDG